MVSTARLALGNVKDPIDMWDRTLSHFRLGKLFPGKNTSYPTEISLSYYLLGWTDRYLFAGAKPNAMHHHFNVFNRTLPCYTFVVRLRSTAKSSRMKNN